MSRVATNHRSLSLARKAQPFSEDFMNGLTIRSKISCANPSTAQRSHICFAESLYRNTDT